MTDKKEPMAPTSKVKEKPPEATGDIDLKLAVHKAAIKLCNTVEFRKIEKEEDGYIMTLMLKGLSSEFNQLQGSRRLVEGFKITGVNDPDILDNLRALAHFGG